MAVVPSWKSTIGKRREHGSVACTTSYWDTHYETTCAGLESRAGRGVGGAASAADQRPTPRAHSRELDFGGDRTHGSRVRREISASKGASAPGSGSSSYRQGSARRHLTDSGIRPGEV